MNVQRFRERSRSSATFRDKIIALKGGDLFVDAISLPNEVGAGGQVRGQVKVDNGAVSINATNPDACTAGDNSIGYEYNLYIDIAGGSNQDFLEQCVKPQFIGTGTNYHSISMLAPSEPGTYPITITLETTGSLERAQFDRYLTVREGGDPNPDPGSCSVDTDCPSNHECVEGECVEIGGGGGGGGGAWLPCIIDPNQDCSPGENTLYAVIGVLLAVVLVSTL